MTLAIETRNLSKHYREVAAVQDLSLKVEQGEIYAFLGLNGAGKTTTIRMLLGMIKPTAGNAHVLNTPVRLGSRDPWARVGYLVETPHAYPELTVMENLEAARRLHPGTAPKAVDQIIEKLGLAEYAHRRTGNLSLGNAQRLGLAKALLHSPDLLILDEPANGLDPAGIVEIRELLLELTGKQGATVFMSSHILGEVSRLASRIGIIHQGRLLQELDVNQLEQNRKRKLLLQANNLVSAQAALMAAGYDASIENESIEVLNPEGIQHPDHVAKLLVQAGTPPTRLAVEEEDLEQYFLRLVGAEQEAQNE
jgi:ABC-2 type transport system ATP-binding protein